MKIRVNGKDHSLSSGPQVALPGLLRDRLDHGGKRTHRSATEEWQPHLPQGDRSAEWWTLTAVLCDPAGTRYFLSWSVTHPGRGHLGQLPPQVVAQIRPGQGVYASRFTLVSYQASIRKAGVPAVFVINDHEGWDEEASTLCLRDAQDEHECAWSFDGERMDLAVSSPGLAFGLKIQGGSQVMWAEGQPGAEGLVQDSADGGHGFCYSLPRLRIAGSLTYTDERGKPAAVDVAGSGWADRQWGDFTPVQGW